MTVEPRTPTRGPVLRRDPSPVVPASADGDQRAADFLAAVGPADHTEPALRGVQTAPRSVEGDGLTHVDRLAVGSDDEVARVGVSDDPLGPLVVAVAGEPVDVGDVRAVLRVTQ